MARSMRNFRLDDDVYAAAQARAKREYTTVTAIVERCLAEYAGLIGSDEKKPARRSELIAELIADKVDRSIAKTTLGYSKAKQAGRERP